MTKCNSLQRNFIVPLNATGNEMEKYGMLVKMPGSGINKIKKKSVGR